MIRACRRREDDGALFISIDAIRSWSLANRVPVRLRSRGLYPLHPHQHAEMHFLSAHTTPNGARWVEGAPAFLFHHLGSRAMVIRSRLGSGGLLGHTLDGNAAMSALNSHPAGARAIDRDGLALPAFNTHREAQPRR